MRFGEVTEVSSPEVPGAEQLSTREDGQVVLLDVPAIDYIEAAGNYACVHVAERTHVLRETMQHLSDRLGQGRFLRIHRSTLVNASKIQSLEVAPGGPCAVRLRDGQRLEMSRRFRSKLDPVLRELGLSR
jgi:two-component system LytT family response regulator